MRTGIVSDLSAQFNSAIHKMRTEIMEGINHRFKQIEDTVQKVQEDQAKLSQELGNISVSGSLQGDTLDSVVNSSVNQALSNSNFAQKKQFDYNVTIACPGVRYSPDENVEEKAKQLIHEGLNLPDVKIVRAMRTDYNQFTRRPGLLKIELESVDIKKRVLSQSGRLKSWTVLGPKVIIRGSQTHEMRTQVANQITFLKGTGLDAQFSVNKNGVLQARPGSQAAANIQASNQMASGYGYPSNPVYPPQTSNPQPQVNGYSNNPLYNPVYGPPAQTPSGPRPRFNPPPAPSYANVVQNQPQTGTRNVNPLLQFMSNH